MDLARLRLDHISSCEYLYLSSAASPRNIELHKLYHRHVGGTGGPNYSDPESFKIELDNNHLTNADKYGFLVVDKRCHSSGRCGKNLGISVKPGPLGGPVGLSRVLIRFSLQLSAERFGGQGI